MILLTHRAVSDHVHPFVCQVHIWGEPMTPKTHNSKKSAATTSPLFIGLCFCSPPRLRSGCFHRSVNVIWDCESHRQRGSGVVGIKAERSDKSCPSALRCRREQQQVTSSAAYKQIFTRPMLSFGSRDMDIVS